MTVLFLDDNPDRINKFTRHVPTAHIATDAQEMIELLEATPEADFVFLDHDLGGQEFVDTRDTNTGSEVVRWIKRNRPQVGQFVVHSLNHPAGRRMEDDLRGMGYAVVKVPFTHLNFQALEALE